MRLKYRIAFVATGGEELFDDEGEDETDKPRKLPDEFAVSAHPQCMLCMFPAFLSTSTASGIAKQHVIQEVGFCAQTSRFSRYLIKASQLLLLQNLQDDRLWHLQWIEAAKKAVRTKIFPFLS